MTGPFRLLFFVILYISVEANGLENCDPALYSKFLAEEQLRPTILDHFSGHTFYSAANNNFGETALVPSSYKYGPNVNNASEVKFYMHDENGTMYNEKVRVVADVIDRKYLHFTLSSAMNALFPFQCTKNLIGLHRCQMAWSSGGPAFQIFTDLKNTESAIAEELDICIKKMEAMDKTIKLCKVKRPNVP